MNPGGKHLFAFCMGHTVAESANLLRQDILGRDRYIEAVRSGWVDTPWWPWALILVGSVALFVWSARWKEPQK